MHDVLRQRLLRRIESLPEGQVYQVLDFIEFLESKYAQKDKPDGPSTLQKFAEDMEDKLRKKAFNPATLREAFQLIAAADRVLADVSEAGKEIMKDLGSLADPPREPSRIGSRGTSGSRPAGSRPASPPSGGAQPAPPAQPSDLRRARRAAQREQGEDAGRSSSDGGGRGSKPSASQEGAGIGEEWSDPSPGRGSGGTGNGGSSGS